MTEENLCTELEILNAQVDVWIDEENYPEIDKCFSDAEESRRTDLERAFHGPVCAATETVSGAWDHILNLLDQPIKLQDLPQVKRIEQLPDWFQYIEDDWSRLLWAKRIRAKIQQKGTDCYLVKLDQVIAYLERNMPFFGSNSSDEDGHKEWALARKKLVVLYLLEMAAAGLGPESRGVAQRAKRYLKQIRSDDAETRNFGRFYELVAEYHMAVGYFHEKAPEKGEAACMKIIQGLKYLAPDSGKLRGGDGPSQDYAKTRRAQHLLYIPAVLSVAEARAKQQLAHSAIKFIAQQFNSFLDEASRYQKARAHLICAEAFLQMESMEGLDQEMQGFVDYLTLTPDAPIPAGLQSRAIPLMLEYSMQAMRRAHEDITHLYNTVSVDKGKDLDKFSNEIRKSPWGTRLFRGYWQLVENRKEDRQGFLIQLAQYLKMLVKELAKDTWGAKLYEPSWDSLRDFFFQRAEALYAEISWRPLLLPKNPRVKAHSLPGGPKCPCEDDRRIDLNPAWEGDFTNYQDTMRDFFKEINDDKSKPYAFKNDEIQFLEAVKEIQKSANENLHWLDREYDIRLTELQKKHPGFDCSKCLAYAGRSAFSDLLGCAQKCFFCQWRNKRDGRGKKNSGLDASDYELIMEGWDKHFSEHVSNRTCPGQFQKGIHFLGLQRWNSTSPAIGLSRGGGYFLYVTGDNGDMKLGVAVDPGFNFVENLQHCGFSIADVDIVLLSHSHLDHLRDFESMVSLCFEVKKRTKEKNRHRLHTVMTSGTYDRLGHLFKSPELRYFIEPYIIDMDKRLNSEFDKQLPNLPSFDFHLANGSHQSVSQVECHSEFDSPGKKPEVKITPLIAFHNDHTHISDSFGFGIEISMADGQPCSIGYTGDTAWSKEELIGQYKGCDALLVHLGSLIGSKDGKRESFNNYKTGGNDCYKLVAKENHPYLPGLLHFLYDIKRLDPKPLVLVSEFGEELRGKIRVDLWKRLNEACGESAKVLPVDVGLDVLLARKGTASDAKEEESSDKSEHRVWCVQCEHYVKLDRADFETYGHDEALFCVCSTCRKSTPHNVLQDRLRRLFEEGRSLPREPKKVLPDGSGAKTT